MIRGIIFDCFGVLFSGSLTATVQRAPQDRQQEVLDLNLQKDYGLISYEEFLARTSEIVGVPPAELEAFMDRRHIRNDELFEFAKSLKSHVKLGLLSNVGNGGYERLFNAEDDSLFDAKLLSHEVGITKPNPEIYEIMAERLGLNPEECVMVDDVPENCEGAEIAGMQSMLHTANSLTIDRLTRILQEKA